MNPGPQDRPNTELRLALIETAARLIATEGPGSLKLRRVADEAGTSTMAIYTHFGGMSELRRAVRREGFARLSARLALAADSDDPVADLVIRGSAYYLNAMANPDLYRVMFMEEPVDAGDTATPGYEQIVDAVRRCIAAGRFQPADAGEVARQLWVLTHGIVTLQLTRLLSADEAIETLRDASLRLITTYGDDPESARRSLEAADRRRGTVAAKLVQTDQS